MLYKFWPESIIGFKEQCNYASLVKTHALVQEIVNEAMRMRILIFISENDPFFLSGYWGEIYMKN